MSACKIVEAYVFWRNNNFWPLYSLILIPLLSIKDRISVLVLHLGHCHSPHSKFLSECTRRGVCAWLVTLILLPLRAPNLNRYGYYLWVIKKSELRWNFTFFVRTEGQYLKRNGQCLRMSSVMCYKYFKRVWGVLRSWRLVQWNYSIKCVSWSAWTLNCWWIQTSYVLAHLKQLQAQALF
jgi:hypothetical protein